MAKKHTVFPLVYIVYSWKEEDKTPIYICVCVCVCVCAHMRDYITKNIKERCVTIKRIIQILKLLKCQKILKYHKIYFL